MYKYIDFENEKLDQISDKIKERLLNEYEIILEPSKIIPTIIHTFLKTASLVDENLKIFQDEEQLLFICDYVNDILKERYNIDLENFSIGSKIILIINRLFIEESKKDNDKLQLNDLDVKFLN